MVGSWEDAGLGRCVVPDFISSVHLINLREPQRTHLRHLNNRNLEGKMKRNVRGALLSGLLFPGIGQFYLGRRALALLFLVPAAVAGLAYADFALEQASAVADQVLSGAVALDPAAIAARIDAQATPLWVTAAGIVFVLCWMGSIAEALWGRARH